jgi:hypothetical protein
VSTQAEKRFRTFDLDGDSRISFSEFNRCVRLSGSGLLRRAVYSVHSVPVCMSCAFARSGRLACSRYACLTSCHDSPHPTLPFPRFPRPCLLAATHVSSGLGLVEEDEDADVMPVKVPSLPRGAEVCASLRRMWDEGMLPYWVVAWLPSAPLPLSSLSPRALFHGQRIGEMESQGENRGRRGAEGDSYKEVRFSSRAH